MENREFKFPENNSFEKTPKCSLLPTTKFGSIELCSKKEVEKEISKELPGSFGIIMDGWTNNSTHYVGVFATYPGTTQCGSGSEGEQSKQVLLAMSPLIGRERMNAASHSDFINKTLEIFGKTVENLHFLVGDNENSNKAVADILRVLFIGGASHRMISL